MPRNALSTNPGRAGFTRDRGASLTMSEATDASARRGRYYYGWNVVALTLALQAVTIGISFYSFALFVVPWLDAFGVDRAQVMFAIFLAQIGLGAVSPICGRLLDRFSARVLVVLGCAFLAGGLFVMSVATAFWQIVVAYATLMPIGMAFAGSLASQTLVTRWFTTRRGVAIGVSAMGTSLGGFAFPLLIAPLISNVGWEDTLAVLAALTVVLTVPAALVVLRRSPPGHGQRVAGGPPPRQWSTKEVLSTRTFWIPVVALVPVNAAFGGVQFSLGAYVFDLGLEQDVAATLIAITAVSNIVGKFVFGSLGDRVDHRALFWAMALCLAVALVLYILASGFSMLAVAAALQGLSTGGVLPLMGLIYAGRFGVSSFGRVMGLVNLFLTAGSVGSLYSGWVFDLAGSYVPAFVTFLILLLPGAIWMWWLPRSGFRAAAERGEQVA